MAVALGAKAATDKVPLGVLVLAAYSNDILKVGFKAINIETSSRYSYDEYGIRQFFIPGVMPWSHGLFMTLIWALLAAVIAYLVYRDQRAAYVIGLVIASHWFLDVIVHPPELPLFFSGSRLYGLSLWMTTTGFRFSMLLEGVMIASGLVIYLIQRQKRVIPSPIIKQNSPGLNNDQTIEQPGLQFFGQSEVRSLPDLTEQIEGQSAAELPGQPEKQSEIELPSQAEEQFESALTKPIEEQSKPEPPGETEE